MSQSKTLSPAATKPDHVRDESVYDFDFFADPGLIESGHARVLEIVRDAPPIFWTPRNGGHWIIAGHEPVSKAFQDSGRFTVEIVSYDDIQAAKAALKPGEPEPLIPLPNSIDPPRHAVYRAPLQSVFSPSAMMALKGDIAQITSELLEAVKPDGGCEFMSAIAEKVPVAIFLKLFGLPLDRQEDYRALVKEHMAGTDFTPGSTQRKLRKVAEIMHDTIMARRDDPRDDLISLLWKTEFYGKPATLNDLENYCVMLFLAGLDTVVNGMGIGVRHLALNPELQNQIRADPKRIPLLSEELLRRYSFTIPPRFVAKDTTFEGVEMRKGEMALLFVPAADVDPRKFANPGAFDLDRPDKAHIAFGTGVHRCLGAHLARIELQTLYEEMLSRLPTFRLDPARTVRFHGGNVWGPDELHILW
jgi:cytochrome P450